MSTIMATNPLAPVTLASHNAASIKERAERLRNLGVAVATLAKVLGLAQTIAESPVCSGCEDLHAELTSGYVTGGLLNALEELGDTIYLLADDTDNIVTAAAMVSEHQPTEGLQ